MTSRYIRSLKSTCGEPLSKMVDIVGHLMDTCGTLIGRGSLWNETRSPGRVSLFTQTVRHPGDVEFI